MKRLIFRAPVQTASGYGVHSRMLLRALDKSGLFDITVMSVPWGNTPLLYDDTPELRRIAELSNKFNPNVMGPGTFDGSVQVTIPNEFMKLAPKNVCVTAGIEVDRVSPVWQQKCNEVADVVVVPSVHSARSFTVGIYGGARGPEQLRLKKPLYILPEWVDTDVFNVNANVEINDRMGPVEEALLDMPDFNFVSVGLGLDKLDGGERKNFGQLIRWFCEQFKGSREVGLVLKLSMVGNSPPDFRNVKDRIRFIKQQAGCAEFPKIKLIHGRLTDREMARLYKHPKAKAFITLTHGEGFGLPIIEAAACGLPVIATDWSGHLDFLRKNGRNLFVPIEYELQPIPESAVWKDVLDAGTRWAVPKEADAKLKMAKVVLSYDKPKAWATELAEHVRTTFNEGLAKQWVEDMHSLLSDWKVKLSKNTLVKTSPSDRTLDNVALVAVGTDHPDRVIDAVRKTQSQIKFNHVVLIVPFNYEFDGTGLASDLRVFRVKPFASVAEHDEFMVKQVPGIMPDACEFFMTVQADGYVLNGSAWDDRFLEYDYIGAPWFWNGVVGNGALCIRSMKLARELQKPEYEAVPQDTNICIKYRKQLEEKGFRWAPVELAARFSVENLPYEGQFGWHGDNPYYGEL